MTDQQSSVPPAQQPARGKPWAHLPVDCPTIKGHRLKPRWPSEYPFTSRLLEIPFFEGPLVRPRRLGNPPTPTSLRLSNGVAQTSTSA